MKYNKNIQYFTQTHTHTHIYIQKYFGFRLLCMYTILNICLNINKLFPVNFISGYFKRWQFLFVGIKYILLAYTAE